MQTMDFYPLSTPFLSTPFLSTPFEACTTFAADANGSAVCSACGWLDAEHEQPGADVHTLPVRAPAPKRLAS